MLPTRDCLTNTNQCDLDADKVNAPLGYINSSSSSKIGEVIKSMITSLIKLQVVLCLDPDATF